MKMKTKTTTTKLKTQIVKEKAISGNVTSHCLQTQFKAD